MKKLTLFLAALLIVGLTITADSQVDYVRMEKDMSIMENVLEEILSESDIADYYEANRIKGVYLENFGVVFLMNTETRNFKDEKAQRAKAAFDNMRTELNRFLLDYAGVIKQLKGSDQVAIVVNTEEDHTWSWTLLYSDKEQQEVFTPYPFMLSASKSAIDQARKSNASAASFGKSVTFTSLDPEGSEYLTKAMQSDIRIMTSIFETSIEDKLGVDLSRNRFQGTYLKGFGVLFVVNSGSSLRVAMPGGRELSYIVAPSPPDVEVLVVREAARAKAAQEAVVVSLKELEESVEIAYSTGIKDLTKVKEIERKQDDGERIQNLITSLTEVLGDYGATLRDLKPNEKIGVLYSSTRNYWSQSTSKVNLFLSATAKDIRDFSNGAITLDQFKTKVSATSYE